MASDPEQMRQQLKSLQKNHRGLNYMLWVLRVGVIVLLGVTYASASQQPLNNNLFMAICLSVAWLAALSDAMNKSFSSLSQLLLELLEDKPSA